MKISSTTQISSSREKVFEAFCDIENAEARIAGIEKVEILSDIRSGLGLRWRETRVMFGKEATEEMEITAHNAPDCFEVEAASHGMHYHSHYQFSDGGNGVTEVSLVFEGTPQTVLAKLMIPLGVLFKGATRKAFEKDMLDLKRHLESDSS